MVHKHNHQKPVSGRPHVRWMALMGVILMALILLVYGYQFWWTE
jgi:hypothetical protein